MVKCLGEDRGGNFMRIQNQKPAFACLLSMVSVKKNRLLLVINIVLRKWFKFFIVNGLRLLCLWSQLEGCLMWGWIRRKERNCRTDSYMVYIAHCYKKCGKVLYQVLHINDLSDDQVGNSAIRIESGSVIGLPDRSRQALPPRKNFKKRFPSLPGTIYKLEVYLQGFSWVKSIDSVFSFDVGFQKVGGRGEW
jgi:hypothetical protein